MSLDITTAQALWFLIPTLPIALWVAWSDLARMKIPNKAVLALMIVFAVVGLIALPLDVWAWRWLHFIVVLACGFVINMTGLMGAGDAKFAAAMAPFVAVADAFPFLYLFSAVLVATFLAQRLSKRIPALRSRFPDWESWDKRDFPMGIALAPALCLYFILGLIYGA
jgi:prepilin peptidase CpaA